MLTSARPFVLASLAALATIGPSFSETSEEQPDKRIHEAPLRPGASVVGELHEECKAVHTPTLDDRTRDATARGVRYAFLVETAGVFTIDLRSYLFDAYLVLENHTGELIEEDDDGLAGTQSRIVASLEPGRYGVVACAAHGVSGPFTLEIHAGTAPSLGTAERIAADTEDARRTVEERESTLGEEHPRTAASLSRLAELLLAQGQYAEAEALLRRSLAIQEETLGDDPTTARTLVILGELCGAVGRTAEAELLLRRALTIQEAARGPDHPETAQCLNVLAGLCVDAGRYDEAESLYRRALQIRETALGANRSETAQSLHNLALLHRAQGRYTDAEPLFRRALQINEATLGPDHPSTADNLDNLAGLCRMLGRYDEAEPLYRRALAIRETVLGEHHPDTGTSLNNLAWLHESLGQHAESESLFRRALAVYESALGPEHPNTATILSNLAFLCRSQGRYAEAEAIHERTLGIKESTLGPDHPDTAASLNELASLLRVQGRYAEAEPLLKRALTIRESTLGADNVTTAVTVNGLASLYKKQGRLEEAEPLYQRALEAFESVLGTDHPHTATVLSNLAAICESQRRFQESERLYRRALEIFETVAGKEHPRTATTLNSLAVLYGSMERSEEEGELHQRALAIRESVLGPNHPHTATSVSNLGVWHHSQGRISEADPLYRRALAIREAAYGSDHPDTAMSRRNLVEICDAQGRSEEAMQWMLRAVDGVQSWILRELVSTTSDRRFSIAGKQRSYIDRALSDWLDYPDAAPPTDRIYRRVCAWKGVVFRHVVRLSRALAAASAGDLELRQLRGALADLEGQLSVIAYAERIADPEAHNERLAALRARRGAVQRDILSRLGIEPEREATDGAELSRLLPERSAVLDFLIHLPVHRLKDEGVFQRTARWDAARVLCFLTVAGAGEPVLVDLGDAATVRTSIDAWLDRITGGRRGMSPDVEDGEAPGDDVRKRLVDPILAALPNDTTRLFVIADDFLGEVPFGAIPIGSGRYVLEAVDVVYATDPVTLRDRLEAVRTPDGAAPSILAVGAADYDAKRPATAIPPGATIVRGRDSGLGFSRNFGPLPGTAAEVDGLIQQATRAFPDAAPPQVLKGRDANEEAVKALAAGRTIVHFATHGFFEREGFVSRWDRALERAYANNEARGFAALSQPSNPWRGQNPFAGTRPLESTEPGLLSGLVLAGANIDGSEGTNRDDGVLTATEVAALDLSACRLAVLSACQSSLGTGKSGEGLQSLRRAFQEAGAQSVIASLWKVDDAATQRLMRALYEELWSSDRGVGDALRRARLKLMRETDDPYYWGAFTLSGEWR